MKSNTASTPTPGRTHAHYPGPIGNPRAGRAARFSFLGQDGMRQWHREIVNLPETTQASIKGAK